MFQDSTDLYRLVDEFFKSFSYKPDTTFSTVNRDFYGITIEARRKLPDSTSAEHELVEILGAYTLPISIMMMREPRETLVAFVKGWIYDLERHEADEWMRLDGTLLVNPHAKVKS